ncbi:rab-like protein 6 [Styela clava]
MFQSFKKWVKNDDAQQKVAPPSGMQMMKGDLQRKFAKGVQYNLKIVIRGERNTGKTCLWHRLRGLKFVEEYLPTAEIQVASIQWDYKATDDVVKVDVWDVVDQGKSKRKESKGLKLSNEEDEEDPALDASFLDVYKHTHAVIMTFDITKRWTFAYIEKELPKVPNHIPVLVLANFRDMGHHRVITIYEIEVLIESIERPHGSASVMFYESSMRNGFGLKYVHKFFNMPFLLVQRESLLKQLETNHLDLESCIEELSTEEHGYDMFVQRLGDKKTKVQSTPSTPTEPGTSNEKLPANSKEESSTPKNQSQPPDQAPSPSSKPVQENVNAAKNDSPGPSGDSGLFSPSQMESQTPSQIQTKEVAEKKGFMSRFFRRSSAEPTTPQTNNIAAQEVEVKDVRKEEQKVTNVEEFIPDDDSVDDFLNEIPEATKVKNDHLVVSSDEDAGNPMVAGFQEELDSEDDVTVPYRQTAYISSDSDTDTFKPTKQQQNNIANQLPKVTDEVHEQKPQKKQLKKVKSDSSSEESVHHEITADVDISSDENIDNYVKDKDDYLSPASDQNLPSISDQTSIEIHNENTVSQTSNSLPSHDEAPRHPPVAIIAPLQAEDNECSNEEDEIEDKNQSLGIQLNSADLDFLEGSGVSEPAKEERRHKSKKSSRRSEGDSSSKRRSEKSHSKNEERKHRTKSKQDSSQNNNETKDRRKKKKSKKPEPSATSGVVDDDLEAFLNA